MKDFSRNKFLRLIVVTYIFSLIALFIMFENDFLNVYYAISFAVCMLTFSYFKNHKKECYGYWLNIILYIIYIILLSNAYFSVVDYYYHFDLTELVTIPIGIVSGLFAFITPLNIAYILSYTSNIDDKYKRVIKIIYIVTLLTLFVVSLKVMLITTPYHFTVPEAYE